MTNGSSPHRWRFFRIGGFDQVAIETGDDLRHLQDLDPKLWTVLGCPTTGLEFDARTLALMDTDGDGQIRVPEILAAVRKDPARFPELAKAESQDPGSKDAGGDLGRSFRGRRPRGRGNCR